MPVLAVIPARYASSRFPGKPLADRTGKFLIQHVYERVALAERIAAVIVATDDARIADAVRAFGGRVEMTRDDHQSGTDRIAEVVRRLSGGPSHSAGGAKDAQFDVILNVQGDEPEIEPSYLDRLVARLEQSGCPAATLACPFPSDGDPADPNAVKVVVNRENRALYFSRSLIPYARDASDRAAARHACRLHLGVYAYRQAFLLEFAGWEPSALEKIEKLEQLRVLDRGHAMAVEIVERASVGIDTPADYDAFVARVKHGR